MFYKLHLTFYLAFFTFMMVNKTLLLFDSVPFFVKVSNLRKCHPFAITVQHPLSTKTQTRQQRLYLYFKCLINANLLSNTYWLSILLRHFELYAHCEHCVCHKCNNNSSCKSSSKVLQIAGAEIILSLSRFCKTCAY